MTLSVAPTKAEAVQPASGCPVHHSLPQRKTTPPNNEVAAKGLVLSADNIWHVHDYEIAKKVLRAKTRQAGFEAEAVKMMPSYMKVPILFLEGKEHLNQRKQTARFFTPATTRKNYREMMVAFADEVIEDLERKKEADLSNLSMRLAVNVAAQVVGLTDSLLPGMSKRIDSFLGGVSVTNFSYRPRELFQFAINQYKLARFFYLDINPAIKKRRKVRQEDVISHLLDNDYGNVEIMSECITYGAAGMVTTREFISVAAWHMIENAEIRQTYLAADEATRYQMLHELLRLEPVIARLQRRTEEELTFEIEGEPVTIPSGSLVDIHIYQANADESAVGEDALAFCPERELAHKVQPYAMSFGDGNHRCPGAYVAIQESDIFLQKLLAIPTLRIAQAPTVSWNDIVNGYELRDFIIAVD